MNRETTGMIFLALVVLAVSLQPAFGKLVAGEINPLFSAAVTALFACVVPFLFLVKSKRLLVIFHKDKFPKVFLVGFFGTTLALLTFLYGARLTSGINIAIPNMLLSVAVELRVIYLSTLSIPKPQ